jgi:hypothetical protein
MGDIVTLPQRLSESYDPEELGRQAFEKAKGERSLTLMQDAYDYFMDANIRSLAQECDAYISLYKYDYEQNGCNINNYIPTKFTKPVIQYDLDMNFIAEYESAREAEKATGIGYKMISRVCNYKRPYTHGFIFRFKEAKTIQN